ncbi:MAG: SMC-Scp complex subunit ScpB [Saprospiraceae bacterium]
MENLLQHIEALIFVSEQAISLREIKNTLEEIFEQDVDKETIVEMIEALKEKYRHKDFAFAIAEISGGYQFLTKQEYHETIGTYLKQKTKKRLSKAALETLSIVAYKQPVTKVEVEQIRGVNSDYSMQKLLEKELVTIVGRSDKPGRPLLYSTSPKFMDYFGIKSLKDFKEETNEIGEKQPIEEEPDL